MVYLLALHASALQTNTTKFKQDFIGPLFIDTALDKTHFRLKDATGLLLDGTYHMNRILRYILTHWTIFGQSVFVTFPLRTMI